MKGLAKAIKRTPFNVSSKIGLSKKSKDAEFDDYDRQFTAIETGTDKLIKDIKAFTEAVNNMFTSSAGFATHYGTIFQPIGGEFEILDKHPESQKTLKSVTSYQAIMEELRTLIGPELELIQSRILGPVKELQGIVRVIRKTITKREHKLTDYDRHNNSLTKLREKKEKSLSDEKNLFKLEQDFEIATNEYEYINSALKQDLPRFMELAAHFIDPLFNSLYYMELNIYYLIMEKMNGFAEETKYDLSNTPGSQIASDYESQRTDAWEHIEALNIVKRLISASRVVQAARAQNLNRANTVGSGSSAASNSLATPPPSRTYSSASLKKSAPPPPSATSAPPPYTPNDEAPAPTQTKRAPPPPPPLKSKPKPTAKYVVALYDFAAQADGDLSFSAGDRIELVERTASAEDWWTGRVKGRQGVFPGNYVQET